MIHRVNPFMWLLVFWRSMCTHSRPQQLVLVAVTLLGSARGVYMPYTYDRITYPPDFYTDIVDLSLSSSTFHESSESDYDSRFVPPHLEGTAVAPHKFQHTYPLNLSIDLS